MLRKNYMRLFMAFLITVAFADANAQNRKRKDKSGDVQEIAAVAPIKTTPKLVVGIIVDQMRYDYLTRFWDHYGEGGFKRMVNEGFNCKNQHFNYMPTVTGPGHASVYTGTTPATHGIIANDWYDKETGKEVYCASDDSYNSVGTTSDAGKMSPHRMKVTTITDQLRLHTQMKGKTIAISLKDRGAVLPGGHTANAAYWFYGSKEGNWITSSYYMNDLPDWVKKFNSGRSVDQYKKPWTTVEPIANYGESGTDANTYEGKFKGETTTAFPHDLPSLWDANGGYDLLKSTPYGNSMTADFAITALKEEQLGADAIPDFLAVSFSSTDYVGHFFGVNSKEIEDTYIQLDRDLARLFTALDAQVGKGEYTVFLTADHGGVHVPAYLKDSKIPAGYAEDNRKERFIEFLKYTYGTTDIVKNLSNDQLFLNYDVIHNLDLDLDEVEETMAHELLKYPGVEHVYTGQQMWKNQYDHGIPYLVQNGYNDKRSGDVIIVPSPGYLSYSHTGSSHGSPYSYDTHVPLLFFGKGIHHGSTVARTQTPDVAPTIAALLGIQFPDGTTGDPIVEVLD